MTVSSVLTLCVVGNANLHVAERARVFAERGHRVFLVSELPAEVPGVTVLVPRSRWTLPKLGILERARAIVTTIDSCQADVVHVHFARGFLAWIAPAARTRPLIVSVMGGDVLFDEREIPARDRRLTTGLLRAADLVTAKSRFLADVAAELAPDVPRQRVMWGVDTSHFAPQDSARARRRLGLPEAGFFVLSPRALSPLYNIDAIVAGFAAAFRSNNTAFLLIAEHHPDHDYHRQIEALAGRLGVADRTRFLPGVPSRDTASYYAAADVVVSATVTDGLPQTLLEAMACGRPHVLPPLPRYGEVVAPEREVLFASPTAEELGAALTRVFHDPQLRRRLGVEARATALRVADRERELEAMERAYRERVALARRPSAGARLGYLAGVLWEHLRA